MYWWVELIIYVVLAWYSYENRPEPQVAPPARLDEVDVPTAKAGQPIPVVFGTRQLKSPNVVWYGDLRTEPVVHSVDKK